ncbi:MAG: DUF917 domain-containing protein [Pseudomonadota bacterium]
MSHDETGKSTWILSIDDVASIATGATLLGAGGGGDPYISLLAARQMYALGGRQATVIDLDAVDDDALILCVAGFGAPTVMKERLFEPTHVLHALRTLEAHLGRSADALIAAEMGGGNALYPILAAAECGLPILDGDGMGRAFPELQMTSMSLGGVAAAPFAMTDEHHNTVICEARPDKRAEAFARITCTEMGLASSLAAYPMSGRDAKRVVIRDTMTLSLKLGRIIAAARQHESPIDYLVSTIGAEAPASEPVKLYDGKVVDVYRSTERGFAVGWFEVAPLTGTGSTARIEFQNEYLAVTVDGEPRALAPDLICAVDRETAEPIPTPDIRFGQRLSLLGLSCDKTFKTSHALTVVGPQAFGLDYAYRPLAELAAAG